MWPNERIFFIIAMICVVVGMPGLSSQSSAAEPQLVLQVTQVGFAAPDILSVTILDGSVQTARQIPYVAKDGDAVQEVDINRWVIRDGAAIGALAGRNKDVLLPFDKVVKPMPDPAVLQKFTSFSLASADDMAYKAVLPPTAVFRKTHPYNVGRISPWEFASSSVHVLYLRLPHLLKEGSTYTLSFPGLSLKAQTFLMKSDRLVSEAIHVSQIGFRPDELAKVAFVSCWMGDGGGLPYSIGTPFLVVDAVSGKTIYRGTLAMSKAAADLTEDVFNRNYNGADVYIADFTSVKRTGRYKIVIPGIGCSTVFEINANVWNEPFRTSVRGLYHQRSGIALGPPYTTFAKQRDFNPADGLTVHSSTAGLFDTGNGPIGYDLEPTNFGFLVKGFMPDVVPNAWGGYHDAGDWDRRIQHLASTRDLLDLVEMFPKFASKVNLNIPESGGKLPDMLDEALWGLDVYRRMQTKEGGIRGGIESEEHPRYGETSWLESLRVMAYAPDPWASYTYAGTAAHASSVLGKYNPALALEYKESALRAMEWAEKQPMTAYTPLAPGQAPVAGSAENNNLRKFQLLRDTRNFASAELFRLTGDTRWNEIFKSTTMINKPDSVLFQWMSHDQSDGAWVYARTKTAGVDVKLRDYCKASILRAADERLAVCNGTGFRWTKYPWKPFGIGNPSVPDAVPFIWADYLTNDRKYLRGIILTAQFGAGANPMNMTFTTGVGQKFPQNPLHLDSRMSGQPAPPGITVLGPMDPTGWYTKMDWGRILIQPTTYPALDTWPPIETYMDIMWNSLMCEFTVHDTIAPNFYCWGYLAARGPIKAE